MIWWWESVAGLCVWGGGATQGDWIVGIPDSGSLAALRLCVFYRPQTCERQTTSPSCSSRCQRARKSSGACRRWVYRLERLGSRAVPGLWWGQ